MNCVDTLNQSQLVKGSYKIKSKFNKFLYLIVVLHGAIAAGILGVATLVS